VARATPVTLAACDATPFVEVHGRAHADKLERQLLINQGDDMNANRIEIRVIPAELITVDFEVNTWTLEVAKNARAKAGKYIILTQEDFMRIIDALNENEQRASLEVPA
jgi:hypothetical protein